MIKQSSRLYAKNWEAVGTGENLLNQEVDKEMYREIYLTDRRFNMISRAKKYVAVLPFFVCVGMNTHLAKPLDIEKMKNTIKDICP